MTPIQKKTDYSSIPASLPEQRILLVDEDSSDLKYYTQLLQRLNYSVQAFSNFREAEKSLSHGYFDLVIVSQNSPGFETLRLVKFTLGRERYTPVIVLTHRLDVTNYLQAMQFGASDYLVKPLTRAEFGRVVMTHCQPRQREISAGSSGSLDV